MTKKEFIKTGLCEQFVLGLTSPEESKLVVDMLEKYPDLKTDCMKLEGCMEQYARANAIAPPASLRKTVLNKIDEITAAEQPATPTATAPPRKGIFIPTWGVIAAAASLVGFLFFSFYAWDGKTKAENDLDMMSSVLGKLQKDCAETSRENELYAMHNTFLKDPNTVHVHLRDSETKPRAVVYWNESKDHCYMKLLNLPPPPEGKTYQMWADIDDEMVSMGTFEHGKDEMIRLPYMAKAASLNMTIEEGEGSDHPDVSQLVVNGLL